MTDSPFSSIIIAGLVIGALALSVGFILDDSASTYNKTVDSQVFTNITSSARGLTVIANDTASSFYGNKTSTSQSSAIDRFVSSAYGSIQVIGEIPDVFVNIVESATAGIGLAGYGEFIIAGVVVLIIGIALYLAVGRR